MVTQRIATRVNDIRTGTEQDSTKEVAAGGLEGQGINSVKGRSGKYPLLDGKTILQGIMWHEILSDPLCKRRRER